VARPFANFRRVAGDDGGCLDCAFVLGLSSVAKGPAGLSVSTFAGDLWIRWAGPFAIVISPLLQQNA
jgi:hypothetical protein